MWTEELQQQTRELFEKQNGAFMKHFGNGKFGICILVDGTYTIHGIGDSKNDKWEYDSIEDMISDGWVID